MSSTTNTRSDRITSAAAAGRVWSQLTGFQRDILTSIGHLGPDGTYRDKPHGLAIKQSLEAAYGEVSHGRLYPNLNDLAAMGLVEKSQLDARTNSYTLTPRGQRLLAFAADNLADAAGYRLQEDSGSESA